MGLRLRRSVKLFPGVRINFSLSGISASIGMPGASVTVGPRGTHLNLGVPGTGLSYRTRIDRPERSADRFRHEVAPPTSPDRAPLLPPSHVDDRHVVGRIEYRSAAAESLSSPGMRDTAALVAELNMRRRHLTDALTRIDNASSLAERRLARSDTPLLRWITADRRRGILSIAEELKVNRESVRQQIDSCSISAEFELSGDLVERFGSLAQRFASLRSSQYIWDISESLQIDRARTRSAASQSLMRQAVRFSTQRIDIIHSEFDSLHLHNANGGDIYVFPCFVAVRRGDGDFAFLDIRELELRVEPTRFIEEEVAPTDSDRVGHAWARANKDGSPDRRFADNHQIPVYRYGHLFLSSATGLNEAYMFSNWKACAEFGEAFLQYQRALAANAPSFNPVEAEEDNGADDSLPALELPRVADVPTLMNGRAWAASAFAIVILVGAAGSVWKVYTQPTSATTVVNLSAPSPDPRQATPRAATPALPPLSVPGAVNTQAPTTPPKTDLPAGPKETADKLSKEEIALLQRRLKELRFDPGPADGVAGTRTVTAVKAYEASQGRAETGIITRRLFDEIIAKRGR